MENEVTIAEPMLGDTTIKNKKSWEEFVKGDVLNFLIGHNLQGITVDDGTGKKASIKITSSGDYKVQITSNEIL